MELLSRGRDRNPIQARIAAGIEDMPPICPTTSRVLRLINNIDASPADLLRVIRLDPVLTGRLLRMINSPLFGLEREITSVGRAMVILGLNTVKNLIVSTAAFGVLADPLQSDLLSASMWSHSLWVGVAARSIARERQESREGQEMAFMGGILHDLGEVCILRAVPGVYHQFGLQARSPERHREVEKLEFERSLMGLSHEEVGLELARRWELPEGLAACMSHHHSPLLSGPHAVLACTVYAASYMSFYQSGEHKRPPLEEPVLRILGVDEGRILRSVAQVEDEVSAAHQFLET